MTRIGLIGGGVIGGGWAARFSLHGHDVKLFDPAANARSMIDRQLANARGAYGQLGWLDREAGKVDLVDNIAAAVGNAGFIQESVPERLELKQEILAEISRHAPADTVIASSTSGLRPSDLQKDMVHPGRFVVGHPFVPPYLVPLVEVCGGAATSNEAKEKAIALYRSVAMRPLHVRNEVDGFIADRLMEAMWREALWLVHDGVATAEEIDDAIRFGPGLRWAFFGPFLTYRVGGGEAGMRHFMEQFGPSLKWPWTKLMDTPELDDALLDRICEQSDAQAGGLPVSHFETMRDNCLVEIMKGLATRDFGAGEVLNARAGRP
ncbi:MAG: L-carnitine dehydrogenase [Geminicoccaceae bacterium]|nr:L-carnitine dehydrogenase [Geminicoccaceae bacterium]